MIRRLQPAVGKTQGHQAVHAAGSGPYGGRPREPDAISVQPRGPEYCRIERLDAPSSSSALKESPELRDVSSDQQDQGLEARLDIDRSTASRYRDIHTTSGQYSLRCFRPAADIDHFHPVEPVPGRSRGQTRIQAKPRQTQGYLHSGHAHVCHSGPLPRQQLRPGR